MIAKEIVISCESGLNNRQAAVFVRQANAFACSICLESGNRKMNGKSLLGILSLGVTCGSRVVLSADGQDEEEAMKTLEQILLENAD